VNSNDQAISAEQKRRCNIQHGFDRLQTLVPALADGKSSKASKAAMLQKTAEYIKELRVAREARMRDLSVYKREIEQLSEQISECQNQLPANGVSVIGNLNKMEKFEQKFNAYVKERTIDNWKFYLFSLILKPLFDNFINTINTSSKEDMDRTFYEWQHKYCNLPQLRPRMFFYLFILHFSIVN
jgi:MAX-like protein X